MQTATGAGSTFTLFFPAAQGEPTPSPAADEDLPFGNGQTVLVLDDEPALVALAEEMLAGLGYEPVGFRDPAAALQAVRDDAQRFDLVITDEVMPTLSGTRFTQALRGLHADLPVLLVSGYGGPELAARAAAAGVTCVLAKPLQRAELARALSVLSR